MIKTRWFNVSLLVLWIAVGALLRFWQLASKPPWTDEITTMVFSLGNSYQSVPLNEIINLEVILQPLRITQGLGISDVITRIMSEDIHPPIYFVLAHLWLKLFPTTGDYASFWAARSLSAFLGVLSIPALYALAKIAFRSRLAAHCSAAAIAVSPYGIFLAQEARHYTLAILFVIASLSCLIVAINCLWRKAKIPWWLVLSWLIINALGIATHYFFCLTLLAQAVALISYHLSVTSHQSPVISHQSSVTSHQRTNNKEQITKNKEQRTNNKEQITNNKWRLGFVGIGTLASGLVWLPSFLTNRVAGAHTDWIVGNSSFGWEIFKPIFQALAAWVTMLSLLPVEAENLFVVIVSGAAMIVFFVWSVPILIRGGKRAWQKFPTLLATRILVVFVASAIALFFAITYFLGFDLTRGARYNFVYFPAVMALVGVSLAYCWRSKKQGKRNVAIILLMGLISSLVVANNLGYQKYYRPDLFVPIVQENSTLPVLFATTYRTIAHKGEMMGLAWELQQQQFPNQAEFLLIKQHRPGSRLAARRLQNAFQQVREPFDLWLVNFRAPVALDRCLKDTKSLPPVDGYDYQLYHCGVIQQIGDF